jgi:hypothetical protein
VLRCNNSPKRSELRPLLWRNPGSFA